jgi:hypothetical protein
MGQCSLLRRSKRFVMAVAWIPTLFLSNSPWLWKQKTLSFQRQLYEKWTLSNLFSFSCANILIVRQQLPVSGWLCSSKYTAEQLSTFTCTLAELRWWDYLIEIIMVGLTCLSMAWENGSWYWLWVKWDVAWMFLTENYLEVLFWKIIKFTLNVKPVFCKMDSFQLRTGIPMPNKSLVN